MKKLLLIIIFFCAYSIQAQMVFKTKPMARIYYSHKYTPKQFNVRKGIQIGGMFISGIAYGYNQLSRHHFYKLQRKHPNINEQFWGKDQWKNKYKNGDPAQGKKFFGSTTFFVPFTDAHHMTMMVDHLASIGGVFIGQAGMEKNKWYYYATEFVALFIVRSFGFALVTHYYDL